MTTQGTITRTESGELKRVQLGTEDSAYFDTQEDVRTIAVIDGSLWVTFTDTMSDVVIERGEKLRIGGGRGAVASAVGAPASFFVTEESLPTT